MAVLTDSIISIEYSDQRTKIQRPTWRTSLDWARMQEPGEESVVSPISIVAAVVGFFLKKVMNALMDFNRSYSASGQLFLIVARQTRHMSCYAHHPAFGMLFYSSIATNTFMIG